ncbi:MAG: TolC family protein [bacterium]
MGCHGRKGILILVAAGLLGLLWACNPYLGPVGTEDGALDTARVLKRWETLALEAPSGPLTLERAIQEALGANPELRQIQERLSAAAEQVRQAEAAFYPRLVFAQEFSITDNPVFAFMQYLHQRRLNFAMEFNDPGVHQNVSSRIQGEWSLFEGGARIYQRRAAAGHRDATASELLAARNRLVASVTEAYFRWLQSLAFLDVAEKAVNLARINQQLGEAKLRAQVALESDLLRLKSRTAEAEGNRVTARAGARKLQAALERLLARPLREEEIPDLRELAQAAPSQQLKETSSRELLEKALIQRPEIQAARFMILAARQRLKAARAELLPKVGARAWYSWDSEELRGGGESWLASLQATWPLFQGGITLSRIREASSRLREMEARGEQVALDVALEVHQAAIGLEEASARLEVAASRRELAGKALEEVRSQYAREVVTVDALLNAELEWSRAEVSYSAALFDQKIASAALRQALGEFARWVEVGS